MRLTSVILTASLLALAVPLAAAHTAHNPCLGSKSIPPNLLLAHVDFWDPRDTGCLGAAVVVTSAQCSNGIHVDDLLVEGMHVFALVGPGCQTGVVQETSLLP